MIHALEHIALRLSAIGLAAAAVIWCGIILFFACRGAITGERWLVRRIVGGKVVNK